MLSARQRAYECALVYRCSINSKPNFACTSVGRLSLCNDVAQRCSSKTASPWTSTIHTVVRSTLWNFTRRTRFNSSTKSIVAPWMRASIANPKLLLSCLRATKNRRISRVSRGCRAHIPFVLIAVCIAMKRVPSGKRVNLRFTNGGELQYYSRIVSSTNLLN